LKPVPAHIASGSTMIQVMWHDAVTILSSDLPIPALEWQIAPGVDSGAEGLCMMVTVVAHLGPADSTALEERCANVEILAAALQAQNL
jgi:hypothetical protein